MRSERVSKKDDVHEAILTGTRRWVHAHVRVQREAL